MFLETADDEEPFVIVTCVVKDGEGQRGITFFGSLPRDSCFGSPGQSCMGSDDAEDWLVRANDTFGENLFLVFQNDQSGFRIPGNKRA
jgi:hypothetical protein